MGWRLSSLPNEEGRHPEIRTGSCDASWPLSSNPLLDRSLREGASGDRCSQRPRSPSMAIPVWQQERLSCQPLSYHSPPGGEEGSHSSRHQHAEFWKCGPDCRVHSAGKRWTPTLETQPFAWSLPEASGAAGRTPPSRPTTGRPACRPGCAARHIKT